MVEDARQGFRNLETSDMRLCERNVETWKDELDSDTWLLWQTRLAERGQSVAGSSPDGNDGQSRR